MPTKKAKKQAKKPKAKPKKVSRKPVKSPKAKAKKKAKTVLFTVDTGKASGTPAAEEVVAPQPVVHAADKVDINNIPLEELMQLAGHECSCRRLQRAQGVRDPKCSGECTHAKAVQELSDRGIVA